MGSELAGKTLGVIGVAILYMFFFLTAELTAVGGITAKSRSVASWAYGS